MCIGTFFLCSFFLNLEPDNVPILNNRFFSKTLGCASATFFIFTGLFPKLEIHQKNKTCGCGQLWKIYNDITSHHIKRFLSLRVFGLLSSSLLLFPQSFG